MDDLDIVREAEEDLKKERLQKLWDEYKAYIISIIAGLILGTAAVSFYANWKLERDQSATTFIQKTENLLDEDALSTLAAESEKLPAKQQAIAQLIAAGKAITVNDVAQAETLLREVSDNRSADPYFRDMAAINLAGLILRKPEAQVEDIETTLARPLRDGRNIWHAHAKFYLALALASKEQNYAAAKEIMDDIRDLETAPPGVAQLAIELGNLYAQKAMDKQG